MNTFKTNTSKFLQTLLLVTALSASTVACKKNDETPSTTQTPSTTLSAADIIAEQTAIKQLITDYGTALAASDPSKVAGLFAQNAILLSAGAPTVTGPAQIKSSYEGLFSALTLTLQFTPGEIVVVNKDYAFATSTSAGNVLVKANGQISPGAYRELWVFTKENGQWKIARYMFNQI
ncbi:YybH family protein [Hymenobacter terrenus]|uniref:YybH family protein n=1 Tax=Hymenobacter terrenus TaxID=1629124 RepID=UPI000695DB10|nr:SgcJ/EcaC family oxidoreductase [Hymenobacter terrenus]